MMSRHWYYLAGDMPLPQSGHPATGVTRLSVTARNSGPFMICAWRAAATYLPAYLLQEESTILAWRRTKESSTDSVP